MQGILAVEPDKDWAWSTEGVQIPLPSREGKPRLLSDCRIPLVESRLPTKGRERVLPASGRASTKEKRTRAQLPAAEALLHRIRRAGERRGYAPRLALGSPPRRRDRRQDERRTSSASTWSSGGHATRGRFPIRLTTLGLIDP